MNRKWFVSALLTLIVGVTQAQVQSTTALEGAWSGKLNVMGMALSLVLHLEQTDGYVKASFDSPDQGVKGIPCFKEFLSNDSVAVKVEAINATYRARLKGDQLVGTFSQMGMSFPLVLKKGEEQFRRPQNPTTPYPYKTEEVTFTNDTDGATLAGTLTYPQGYETMEQGTVPVVLMVTGSGPENRDEEIFEHKPFLVIADYLARNGIATLRYDDRGVGASVGGDVKGATTEDFMRDAAAGIAFLRRQPAFGKVGCLGHSEGGTIAFMLAARQMVDFVVSLAGPGVKGDTLLVAQSNRILQLSGMPAQMTTQLYRQQPAVQQSAWLRWFMDYDPSDDIRRTTCPVFALNGSRDTQVLSTQNIPAIRQLLPSSKDNIVREYPALNHLFQHCTTGLPNEYRKIEETISPEVLSDLAAWIKKVTAM